MKNQTSVAIITARGGSKRIPRKNIRDFLGKPIMQYSIDAALEARIFDEVMVSTDDEEIAGMAKQMGASVPFMRSPDTSGDFSTTADVLSEVFAQFEKIRKRFTYACCLYPTAPFVTAEKLKRGYKVLIGNEADSVIPVTRFSFPIWRSFKMEGERLAYNWPENATKRSQDLPPAFHDCGQFYFFDVAKFLKTKSLVSANTFSIEIPESEVQDIDNDEDWKVAEIKYTLLSKKATN